MSATEREEKAFVIIGKYDDDSRYDLKAIRKSSSGTGSGGPMNWLCELL